MLVKSFVVDQMSCHQQIPSLLSMDRNLKISESSEGPSLRATCDHHNGGPLVTNDLFAHLFVDASFVIEILFAIC